MQGTGHPVQGYSGLGPLLRLAIPTDHSVRDPRTARHLTEVRHDISRRPDSPGTGQAWLLQSAMRAPVDDDRVPAISRKPSITENISEISIIVRAPSLCITITTASAQVPDGPTLYALGVADGCVQPVGLWKASAPALIASEQSRPIEHLILLYASGGMAATPPAIMALRNDGVLSRTNEEALADDESLQTPQRKDVARDDEGI